MFKVAIILLVLLSVAGCGNTDEVDVSSEYLVDSRDLLNSEQVNEDKELQEKRGEDSKETRSYEEILREQEEKWSKEAEEWRQRKRDIIANLDISVCIEGTGIDQYYMYRDEANDEELLNEPFNCLTELADIGEPKPRQFTGQEWCDWKLVGNEADELYGGCANYLRKGFKKEDY